jgi:DNA-binding transcriptional ArsR family regulator
LSTILGNETHVRVLRELSRRWGELSVSMTSDRTALTPQGVRNILDALVASEAVTMIGVGRSRLYQIGSHPLMEAVHEVFAAEETTYSDLMDELRTCLRAHKAVRAAWVYGSVAKGEDGLGSDIDLVIVANDPQGRSP